MGVAPASAATGVDTINWAADTTVDGTGVGTIDGFNATYTTVVGGNAGLRFTPNWNTSVATNGAVGTTGVTHQNAGSLGVVGGGTQQTTVSFTGVVTNPTIYVVFTDAGTTMDFGSLPLTLLDSNHATLAGSVVNFAGSTNTVNDGFAAKITGTFGPGNLLTFNFDSTNPGFDSVTFTLAVPDDTPPTCALTAVRPGPPTQIDITVQDAGSGMGSIVATHAGNASIAMPTFTAGATSPLVVTATKLDQTMGSSVALAVTDAVGDVVDCDPAVVTLTAGKLVKPTTATGLAEAESNITVADGSPGISILMVNVNGVPVMALRLRPGKTRTVDVARAMHPGHANTITLTPIGRAGGTATVVIRD